MIEHVIISVFSIFLVSLFEYGKLLGEVKHWIADRIAVRKGFKDTDQRAQLVKQMPYTAAYEHMEGFYDLLGGQSKLMRLLNCYLCFSSWFVICFSLFFGLDLITGLAVNYFLNRLNESV
jgi:hypothetical protein